MKEYLCSVDSAGASVDFHSSKELQDLFKSSNYNRWVPEMSVSGESSGSGYSVIYEDSDQKTVEFGEKDVKIKYPWDFMRSGETLLYAGYPFMEVLHQKAQTATLHAACVEIFGKGVLFLGESGSGKTTLATKLCSQQGGKLYSNELALVGLDNNKLYCSGGTKFYQFRRESVARSLPHLLKLFPEKEGDSWLDKIIVQPTDIGIKTGEGKIHLNQIYKIHVDESKSELKCYPADNFSTRLNLNENMTRYIRNAVTVVTGGKGGDILAYVPPMDRLEFFAWRKRAIEIILEEMHSLYLSGPSDKITQFIVDQCK